jgi:hypothetical protein
MWLGGNGNVALFRWLSLPSVFACTTSCDTTAFGAFYRIILLAESNPFLKLLVIHALENPLIDDPYTFADVPAAVDSTLGDVGIFDLKMPIHVPCFHLLSFC